MRSLLLHVVIISPKIKHPYNRSHKCEINYKDGDTNLSKARSIITYLKPKNSTNQTNSNLELQILPLQLYTGSFHEFSFCCRLKYLNLTGNDLQSVPQFSFTHSSRLHELYLSDNRLEDDSIPFLCTFTKLRILHIAHNRITEIKNR